MSGSEAMTDKVQTNKAHQSACDTCQNESKCKKIATTVTLLKSEQVVRNSSPAVKKKFAAITDHLRREGFAFPDVKHPSLCWMHQKFGVATFYENQLIMLAEKASSSDPATLPSRDRVKVNSHNRLLRSFA